MKVYLDVCCLNRPFDDQSQPRVAVEAASILRILEMVELDRLVDFTSEMARIELDQMPDQDRRRRVLALLPPLARRLPLNDSILDAAAKLQRSGFDLADAVHLAAATDIGVDVFLTVDDNLRRRASRYPRLAGVRVMDPASFLKEFDDGSDR